jgi:N-methylhydantoinase B/oxoprolinase/acetone carboxylase alpha subunit
MSSKRSFLPAYPRCGFCGKLYDPREAKKRNDIDNVADLFCSSNCSRFFREETTLAEIKAEQIDETRHSAASDSEQIDVITLEVINGALTSACEQMGKTMLRTAYSPVFYEGNDFTCALFDEDIELLAQFEGNPAQLGSLKFAVTAGVRSFGGRRGGGSLFPGDVIIHNDPFLGAPHLPEFCMIKPIFYHDVLVGYAANIAHHTDVGGKSPGGFPGDATEIYQEGIVIPPAKLFERGEEREEIWRTILVNVRNPRNTYGDLMAMYGSLVTAENRMKELVEKYGLDTFLRYIQEVKNYAERRMRAEIERIRPGIYKGKRSIDDDGIESKPYDIRVDVKVEGKDIIFDFRKTDAQAIGPVNCPYGVGVSGAANAIFNLVDPTIPHNEGAFRPLHFIIPPGKLINVLYPRPVSGGNTETLNLTASAVMDALKEAIPERVSAAGAETCTIFTVGGIDDRKDSHFYTMCMWEPGGWGGRFDKDGESAIMTFCGTTSMNFSVEVTETVWPWRINKYELRADSGGVGKYRGGLGIAREYELMGNGAEIGGHANRHTFPPEGIFGGDKGGSSEYYIGKESERITDYASGIKSPCKFSGIRITRGQKILICTPGGGGYGDPESRDPDLVLEDLKNGYISPETARNQYGLSDEEVERTVREYWFEGPNNL